MWKAIPLIVCGAGVICAADSPAPPRQSETMAIVKFLASPEFWKKPGWAAGREWSDDDVGDLQDIAASKERGPIRLRARKILVDLARRSRFEKADEPVVAGAFQHLEAQLKHPAVNKLCLEQGFTHYTVTRTAAGRTYFLIEHVESGGFNGGLNLAWDEHTRQIAGMQVWGDAQPKE